MGGWNAFALNLQKKEQERSIKWLPKQSLQGSGPYILMCLALKTQILLRSL